MHNSQIVTEEESRNARRREHHNISCRFDNDPHIFKIHEQSAHGFSFICSKELTHFKRGVVLEKIRITNSEGVEIIVASGRIAHSTEFDFEQNRFGVNYTKKVLDRTITGKVRVPRHFPELQLDVLMKLPHEKIEWSALGTVKDFTASTSRIGVMGNLSSVIKVGGEIEILIKAGTDEIFHSNVHIIRKRDDASEIIVRFIDKFLDVNRIKTVSTAHQNRKVISSAVQSLETYGKVSDQFKALVCDWRMFLSRLNRVLDQEENKKYFNSDTDEGVFLQGIENNIFTELNQYVARLNETGDSLGKNESLVYKKYFRENLNYFFRKSVFIASIIDKDLGYAGDFETVKRFFTNPYVGESLFGKLMNKFLCSLDAVTAHQDRIRFLHDELCTLNKKNLAEKFNFLSLGSGPAEEVLRFVSNGDFSKQVKATLLDMDSFALADFSDRLQYLSKDNFTIDLVNINILNILRKKEHDPVSEEYVLTYCAGLFDYFGKKVCSRLVKYLIDHTVPGGYVIVTNVDKRNTTRHFMDYCGMWEIIHRNEQEMKELVPPGYPIELHSDKNNANLYMKIMVPEII